MYLVAFFKFNVVFFFMSVLPHCDSSMTKQYTRGKATYPIHSLKFPFFFCVAHQISVCQRTQSIFNLYTIKIRL